MAITDVQAQPASLRLLVRRIGFYVTLVALGLIVAADFVMHAFDFADPHHIHVAVHEIVSATILAIIMSQLIAPRRAIASAQAMLVLFVIAWIGDAMALRFSGLGVFLLLGVIATLVHPVRATVFRFQGKFSWLLMGLTLLSAIPLVPFALAQATYQRQDFEPVHALLGHWEWVATWAILSVALGTLAALRTTGFRLVAWCVGLGAIIYGAVSLVYPNEASVADVFWASIALAGGLLFIVCAEWEARHA